jgi:hypothetical protein
MTIRVAVTWSKAQIFEGSELIDQKIVLVVHMYFQSETHP